MGRTLGVPRAAWPCRPAGSGPEAAAMQRYEIHAQNRPEQPTSAITSTLSVPEIGPWLARAYGEITGVLADQGRQSAGPPYARYHPLGNGRFDVEAGFPASTAIEPARCGASLRAAGRPGRGHGAHRPLRRHGARLRRPRLVGERPGGLLAGDPWEVYFTDPEQRPDPSRWRTEIVQPYRIR